MKQQLPKIAIAQINSCPGAIKENSQNIEKYIKKAQKENVEILIFPRNTILGINSKDLKKDKNFFIKCEEVKKNLRKKYKNIKLLFENEQIEGFKINNEGWKYRFGEFANLFENTIIQKGLHIFVNPVGAFDEKIYEGRSFATYEGRIIGLGKFLKEDLIILDYNANLPLKTYSFEEETFKVLSFGLKDYCQKTGFKKAVLGLSGGLDSAITAVLACEALGADNVLGITMPSKFSTKGSYNDSFKLAENLGMKCIEKPINSLFDEFISSIQEGKTFNDLAEENIQPRIRALILMNYSNRENRLLLSTGNKSECAMGYCTLYGDTCGGINPIADVFKTDLYKISNWINKSKKQEIIPKNILTKAPSAELRPDQKDEDSLPPYEILDDILRKYIEEQMSVEEISKDYDENFVKEIVRKLNFNEFKRHQSTLFFEISKKSLGTDRNFPITAKLR